MFLTKRLRSAGVAKILSERVKSHIFVYDVLATLLNGTDRTSTELVRLGEINRTKKRLSHKYHDLITKPLSKEEIQPSSDCVWTSWLQGVDAAPEVVKLSIDSIKSKYGNENTRIITAKNFQEYVSLPPQVLDKWDKGVITNAHFSDILRTALLVKYGGIWIDSTVFVGRENGWISKTINSSEFFFFQNMRPGSMGNAIFLSSWFLKSEKNNPVLLRLQTLLYNFWSTENNIKDYFLFHIFLHLIFEAFPEELKKVPKIPNSLALELMYLLNDDIDEPQIRRILQTCEVRKLTYKNLNDNPNSTILTLRKMYLKSSMNRGS